MIFHRHHQGNILGITLSIILNLLFLTISFEREVRAAVTLNPSFTLSEQYTDNLFFSAQEEQFDFTTVLSPSLSMAITSKNVTLVLGYDGSAQFHSQHPEADGYFQSLSFDLDLPIINRHLRLLEVKISGEISYSPELQAFSFGSEGPEAGSPPDGKLNDVLAEGEGVQRSGRVKSFRNQTTFSLRYPWSSHFITSASYINIRTLYSGGGLEDTHVQNSSGEAIYHYPLSRRTVWTSSYRVSATFGEVRDLIHQIDTGGLHRLTALVSVNGSIGVSSVVGASSLGTNVNAGISKRHKKGSLDLRYARSLTSGLGVIQGVTRRQSFIGSATYELATRVGSSVQLGYASNRSFQGNQVDVDSYTAGASLSTHFLSWLSGELNYTYLIQQSKGQVGEVGERNIVSFILTAVGPSWRMVK